MTDDLPDGELRREMGCTRVEFLRWLPGASRHAPIVARGDIYRVESEQGTVEISIAELPPRLVHLVLVNGVYVAPEQRKARTLAPGDALAIWPPVAGG